MKLIMISVTAFLIFIAPAFSELTVKDLEKIRSIVKESEDRVTKHVDDEVEDVDKRLNLVVILVVGLIALVVFSVSIPQIIMALQGRRQKDQAEKIEKLEEQIGIIVEQIGATNSTVG